MRSSKKPLKLRIMEKIGLSDYCPRWLRVFILHLVFVQIEKGFKKTMNDVSEAMSTLTDEQRHEINAMLEKLKRSRLQ